MCGINCILNFNLDNVNKNVIQQMNEQIIHRGPDKQKLFFDKNFAFGHCRLSIIDLSDKGDQPMFSHDQRYVIAYNGEIYNFKIIRKQLEKQGVLFVSNSDTEVILNSYITWGTKCVSMFNGMFAFLIWDRKDKKLFGARDRFGIKPLYYLINEKRIIISSEINPIIKILEPVIDDEALIEYFLFRNYLNNKTIFRNVKLFEKGTFFYVENKKLNVKKYYDHRQNIFNNDKTSDINDIDVLLKQSIDSHLISDVLIGSYLSSGIDSSLVTTYATKKINNLNTFTCGFSINNSLHNKYNESIDSKLISEYLNTNHKEIVFDKNDCNELNKLIYKIVEEPRLGVCLANLKISQLVKNYNKVVLSGAGGDELFGGYPWRYDSAFRSNTRDEFVVNYFKTNFRFNMNELKFMFKPMEKKIDINKVLNNFFSYFNFLDSKPSLDELMSSCFLFDLEFFLEGYCLIEDKISMHSSFETRLPFLENNILNFAMNLDNKYKVQNKKILKGKLLLRNLAKKKLPLFVSQKKKQGFAVPYNDFIDEKIIIENGINSKQNQLYDFVDFEYVKNKLNRCLTSKDDPNFLWGLFSFNGLLKNYFN